MPKRDGRIRPSLQSRSLPLHYTIHSGYDSKVVYRLATSDVVYNHRISSKLGIRKLETLETPDPSHIQSYFVILFLFILFIGLLCFIRIFTFMPLYSMSLHFFFIFVWLFSFFIASFLPLLSVFDDNAGGHSAIFTITMLAVLLRLTHKDATLPSSHIDPARHQRP